MSQKEKIIAIVIGVLFIVAIISTMDFNKRKIPDSVQIVPDATTEDNGEYIDYISSESYEDYKHSTETIEIHTQTTEITSPEEISTETDATETTEENYDKDRAQLEDEFYAEINSKVADMYIVSESNINTILEGILRGYIQFCYFVTNDFKAQYVDTDILPNVTDIIINEVDFNNSTSNCTVTTEGVTKNYKVTWELNNYMISSITLEEITQ